MIRPTFLAFETAKRALNISQAGLDIVGHNISNAQTTGYTRQRVDQVSMSMNGISSKYRTFGAASYGSGANFSGVSQIRDVYLDNRFRTEATTSGELGIKNDGLTDINNIFDETMTDGLSAKFSELLNALTVLGQSSNVKEHALVVRDTANQFVQLLNSSASQLESTRKEQMGDLKTTVEQDVNVILKKIADLNKKIKEDNFYGDPSNEFNDERNMLIDQLSEYFDIKVVKTPIKISEDLIVDSVSIELNNSGDPPLKLVDGQFANKIGVTEDPKNGNAIVSLLDGVSGLAIHSDLSNVLANGGIKGYLDIINGEGPNSTGNSFRGVPYYMNALDEYAQQFAEVLNRINNISEQESIDSAVSYEPVLTGSAMDWIDDFTPGTADFSGRNTNMQFELTGSTITATYNDANGVQQTATATYTAGADIEFKLSNGDTAFTVTTDPLLAPPTMPDKSEVLIDAGWPAVTATDGNKNLIVPVQPSITDNGTGKQPAWIDTIQGGVIQFSGKEYDIEFNYNSAGFVVPPDVNPDTSKTISATMIGADGNPVTYYGSYTANGKVQFADENGAVMFTVNTTSMPPESGKTTVDATINAKNIAVSSNWFDDPLYITTTKSNAVNKKEATLVLEGTNNPTWLNKVSMGSDAVSVKNGSYQIYDTAETDPDSGGKIIAVKINGIEYRGVYKPNSTIELKGGNPTTVGLILETNHKPFGTSDAANVATIRNDTGSSNDNINKLLTEMKRANNYSVSGINGGLDTFLTSLQAQMGLDLNSNESMLDASLTAISTLANRRDSVSAVSIDEEGVNMMTYQNYYNAAARYMTTIDEALDKVINGMGTVGR